jgi:hypothetical protein
MTQSMKTIVNAYKLFVGNLERMRSLGVDDVVILKWILKIGFKDMDWIQPAQDRVQLWEIS